MPGFWARERAFAHVVGAEKRSRARTATAEAEDVERSHRWEDSRLARSRQSCPLRMTLPHLAASRATLHPARRWGGVASTPALFPPWIPFPMGPPPSSRLRVIRLRATLTLTDPNNVLSFRDRSYERDRPRSDATRSKGLVGLR